MPGEVFVWNRGGGDEIGGSGHDYYIDGTVFGIDRGLRPEIRETDISPVRLKNKKLEEFIFQHSQRPRRDPLPDLTILPGMKDLFITHAHADHIGGVPHTIIRHSDMTIWGTEATRQLCELQWLEAIKIAERRKEVLPYSESDVSYALSRFEVIHPGQEIKINDRVSILPIGAGHILGAVSYIIYLDGKPIGFHSGDISCSHQRTVPGALKKYFDKLKFMVIDSTRLIEQNQPREEVEEVCKQTVSQAFANGNYIRANVFAIGRAQETFSIFREACPDADIWIDGASGQTVSTLYQELGATGIAGITDCFVRDRDHRQQIINSPEPNIVITPSAMAFGGTSRNYVRHGITRSDHLFVSMGYLDPCSPEYAFFESDKLDVFRFGEVTSPRFCQVARFNATAHCDGHDILEMKDRMNPERTVTVHGDGKKMDEFIAKHPNQGFIKGRNHTQINLD